MILRFKVVGCQGEQRFFYPITRFTRRMDLIAIFAPVFCGNKVIKLFFLFSYSL